jgi:quercetin dioxygenase-like cupin family protein
MEKYNLSDFHRGWFIGNFEPTLFKTDDFEVAVKKYEKGDYEEKHYHKISTEYTTILNGSVEMNGVVYNDGDIIVIKPGESTDFKALTDVTTVVVKTPFSKNDKYLV